MQRVRRIEVVPGGSARCGTQLLGLAALGERIVGTDLSPAAVARVRNEAGRRGLRAPVAVADMRALPVADGAVDGLLCLDNSLPHLTTAPDLDQGLREMGRVLRPGGLVLISLRGYDVARRQQPTALPPTVRDTPAGRWSRSSCGIGTTTGSATTSSTSS